jgi:hypothetical protein
LDFRSFFRFSPNRKNAMIIDGHTHIFPDEIRRDRDAFCARDEGFASLYRNPKARMVGVEALIASMDEAGVDLSVICGFPWKRKQFLRLHNQYLLEAASSHPGRLAAFLSLSFSDPDWSLKELESGFPMGAKGMGEIAFYHRPMTRKDLEKASPLLRVLEARRIPLLLHTNEIVGHPYAGKGTTPLERFYSLAESYPLLPVILAHWGGGLLFYELMPEGARSLRHVYYDTAASPFLYTQKIYRAGCQIAGSEKILFGSDFPLLPPRRYFREMEESGVKAEDRSKILGLNFLKLLNGIR